MSDAWIPSSWSWRTRGELLRRLVVRLQWSVCNISCWSSARCRLVAAILSCYAFTKSQELGQRQVMEPISLVESRVNVVARRRGCYVLVLDVLEKRTRETSTTQQNQVAGIWSTQLPQSWYWRNPHFAIFSWIAILNMLSTQAVIPMIRFFTFSRRHPTDPFIHTFLRFQFYSTKLLEFPPHYQLSRHLSSRSRLTRLSMENTSSASLLLHFA